jgi:hypothetical protein
MAALVADSGIAILGDNGCYATWTALRATYAMTGKAAAASVISVTGAIAAGLIR